MLAAFRVGFGLRPVRDTSAVLVAVLGSVAVGRAGARAVAAFAVDVVLRLFGIDDLTVPPTLLSLIVLDGVDRRAVRGPEPANGGSLTIGFTTDFGFSVVFVGEGPGPGRSTTFPLSITV